MAPYLDVGKANASGYLDVGVASNADPEYVNASIGKEEPAYSSVLDYPLLLELYYAYGRSRIMYMGFNYIMIHVLHFPIPLYYITPHCPTPLYYITPHHCTTLPHTNVQQYPTTL